MPAVENSAVATGLEKVSFHSNPKETQCQRMPKNAQTTAQLHSLNMLVTENAMAPHSNILAWKIPWMEEPGRLQSMGLLRVRHD